MREGFARGVWASQSLRIGAILLLAFLAAGRAAPQAIGKGVLGGEWPLPANLIVPDAARPVVASMWQNSPAFRRQCARLAENPAVIVRIELRVVMTNGLAQAIVGRHGVKVDADVRVALLKPRLYAEHIAHELEHVLEQLDGIDLRRLARQGLDGVVDLGGQYETARARSVGQTVALETLR